MERKRRVRVLEEQVIEMVRSIDAGKERNKKPRENNRELKQTSWVHPFSCAKGRGHLNLVTSLICDPGEEQRSLGRRIAL